jgi:DsbC/DsbD-like thiol-disulfide interchange protein
MPYRKSVIARIGVFPSKGAGMNRRNLLFLAASATTAPAWAGIKPDTQVRLLSGAAPDGAWQAGIEIVTGKDWKTYWRMPGDAGIPPDFDWSGSENVAGVQVLFPAPQRFHDAAGESIGYKTRVLFPLQIAARDAGKPIALKLKAFFAICKDICIPSHAEAELLLGGSNADAGLIAEAYGRVPVAGALVSSVTAIDFAGKPALRIALAAPAPADLDIFVEGAEPAYVHAPQLIDGAYVLPVAGVLDHSALRGKTLRLTLAAANIALEQAVIVA